MNGDYWYNNAFYISDLSPDHTLWPVLHVDEARHGSLQHLLRLQTVKNKQGTVHCIGLKRCVLWRYHSLFRFVFVGVSYIILSRFFGSSYMYFDFGIEFYNGSLSCIYVVHTLFCIILHLVLGMNTFLQL